MTDPEIHPALRAWRTIERYAEPPADIEVLQSERARDVWRLHGSGPGGRSLIAKRCRRDEARREWDIYRKILPRIPVLQVACYGHLEVERHNRAWLFMEDVGGDRPYCSTRAEDRKMAGAWLGLLHRCGRTLPARVRSVLRERGPASFHTDLVSIVPRISRVRGNEALAESDRRVLDDLVRQCEELESSWPALAAYCDRVPKSVVHGDFKEAHIFINEEKDCRDLRLIDWSEGGWGVPALDVAKFLGYSVDPSIDDYIVAVRDGWDGVDHDEVHRLGYVGEVFRCVASIRWEVDLLEFEWVERPMATLSVYRDWMDEILQAAPWSDDPAYNAKRTPKARTWW